MAAPRAEMPFLDHLEELRWRLLYAVLALLGGVVAAFLLVWKGDVIGLLQRPITPWLAGGKLVYTHPGDPFSIVLSAAFGLGSVLALPVIGYQIWAFVAPALYPKEKRVVIPLFLFAVVLFAAGASMAYFVVLPLAIRFLMEFQSASLQPMITAADYFSFVINMVLGFGLAFELPIVVLMLGLLGITNSEALGRFRRHALVACVLLSAVLTPGDLIWTTILMALPLYCLYEMSLWIVWAIERRRAKSAALVEAEG